MERVSSKETDLDAAYSKAIPVPVVEPKKVPEVPRKDGGTASSHSSGAPKSASRPPPEKGLTTCEKVLTVIVILLSVALIVALIFYIFDKNRDFFQSYMKEDQDARSTTRPSSGAATNASSLVPTTAYAPPRVGSVTPLSPGTSLVMTLSPNVSLLTILTQRTRQTTMGMEEEAILGDNDTSMPVELREAVQRIHRSIDEEIDPCDNFYKFACGSWMKENIIPSTSTNLFSQSDMGNKIGDRTIELLVAASDPSDLSSIQKTKVYFTACVDEETAKKRGLTSLKDFLKNELGGWPITHSEWNETQFDFEALMAKLTLLGITPIFNFHVSVDKQEPTKRSLMMEQPTLIMPNHLHYLTERNETTLLFYEMFILAVAHELGVSSPNNSYNDIQEIVNFEIELAKILTLDNEHRLNVHFYNPMTLDDLQGNFSNMLDWKKFVDNVMKSPKVNGDVTDPEIIMNLSPGYFQNVTEVVRKTSKRTLANYVVWAFIYTALARGIVGEKHLQLYHQFNQMFGGPATKTHIYNHCAEDTLRAMPLVVGRLYVEKHFDSESKALAMDMADELKHAFNELLEELDWMDENTKKSAEKKNNHIVAKIGYPDEVFNDTFLEEFYHDLTFQKDTYFENSISAMKFAASRQFRELRLPFNKDEWVLPATDINAVYHKISNQIQFPAGILQPVYFSKYYPRSMNFGGIGTIIGHEITHGFDAEGRNFDPFGHLIQWWSTEAEEKFLKDSKCMTDQYSSFTVTQVNMTVNGELTLSENIADNGGVKQAFRAYRNWVKSQDSEEDPLPGLELNHNQLFFISHAQLYCNLRTDADLMNQLATDNHSPGEFRVIGALQNSKDFAETFSCPDGSYMNPTEKCHVW